MNIKIAYLCHGNVGYLINESFVFFVIINRDYFD